MGRRGLVGKRPRRMRKQMKRRFELFFAILCLISMFVVIYTQLDRQVMPTVLAMARLKANSIATVAINDAVNQTLSENQVSAQDLISYDYNDQGELISWNVNSIMVNMLCGDITNNVSTSLQNIGITQLTVPLGNITGSRIFANIGPQLDVKVLPVGTATVQYENQLRATGINQVNHTVWLNIETIIQVVVPLASEQMRVSRRVVLVDKVMSGKVPPSYVDTTKENILDAMEDPNQLPKVFEYPSVP